MSDASLTPLFPASEARARLPLIQRLGASPAFQSWASRMPVLRRIARREGEALFDLVAGFLHAQVLHALVDLRVLERLAEGPMTPSDLGRRERVPEDRMAVLLRAGVALGLLRIRRGGRFGLSRRGATLLGVPGLTEMILHHSVLYRDMADPAAFFRGETDPDLARFWPYVLGGGAGLDPEAARRYSRLMSDSQGLVAEETLRAVFFRDTRHLLDVGGGSGAFLSAVAKAWPGMEGTLFDLPEVVPQARERFQADGLSGISVAPGSFRKDPLPQGADTISLVRVLYDHTDETVSDLLARCFEALPRGGRVVISEPMTGGESPTRAGDIYFALYTMAMGTGRARSGAEIAALLTKAGFVGVRLVPTHRPYITGVVTATRPT